MPQLVSNACSTPNKRRWLAVGARRSPTQSDYRSIILTITLSLKLEPKNVQYYFFVISFSSWLLVVLTAVLNQCFIAPDSTLPARKYVPAYRISILPPAKMRLFIYLNGFVFCMPELITCVSCSDVCSASVNTFSSMFQYQLWSLHAHLSASEGGWGLVKLAATCFPQSRWVHCN